MWYQICLESDSPGGTNPNPKEKAMFISTPSYIPVALSSGIFDAHTGSIDVSYLAESHLPFRSSLIKEIIFSKHTVTPHMHKGILRLNWSLVIVGNSDHSSHEFYQIGNLVRVKYFTQALLFAGPHTGYTYHNKNIAARPMTNDHTRRECGLQSFLA